jgi:hypothetical protein
MQADPVSLNSNFQGQLVKFFLWHHSIAGIYVAEGGDFSYVENSCENVEESTVNCRLGVVPIIFG